MTHSRICDTWDVSFCHMPREYVEDMGTDHLSHAASRKDGC